MAQRIFTDNELEVINEMFAQSVTSQNIEFEDGMSEKASFEDFLQQYEDGVAEPIAKVITNSNNMEKSILQTNAPVAEVEEQQMGGVVESQSEVSTVQDNDGQASADASSATRKSSKVLLSYDDKTRKRLAKITKICEEEIQRVISDPRYAAVPYAKGENCIIDLKEAYSNNVRFATPKVNRKHGSDEKKTGNSILTYGCQHVLLVITQKMAKVCGLESTWFNNDNEKGKINDDALVFLDGNGRIDFLLSKGTEEWPNISAVFPSKDNIDGLFNLPVIMSEINTQVAVWKTENLVQKRILEEGEETAEGWRFIQGLLNKGYKYQAACQSATLAQDRIKKDAVSKGDATEIFDYFKFAKQLHEALVKRFKETESSPLKTKEFTKEISFLWGKLRDKKGDQEATDLFIEFIAGIAESTVEAINNAVSKKGELNKDQKRKKYLDEAFYKFVDSKGIEIRK